MAHKTNAVRLLDQLGILYELREYEVNPEELAAEVVAAKINMPPEQVFKTLVARGDCNGICMAVIPGNTELDLQVLAVASGDRKIQLTAVKELQALTGYIRGGVTAIGGKKDYPVYADETIELFDKISVSAGIRGTQILLGPADYLRVTKATLAPLASDKKMK
ncbi:MAG TPA: Cys-tRNA(Pro) deacylase [Terriglobales bacterium]|nr:Cys-tRNA(Pro) deacylase [Terriglobales bacterium]